MDHTSSTPLGIGLVGVGRHGSRYVQHLLHDVRQAALAAICRKSGGGLYPGTAIPVFDDYRTMIADPRVQAVVAVTPPSLCHAICLAAVEAGKPILIEKPLATKAEDAARLRVAAGDKLIQVAYVYRAHPATQWLDFCQGSWRLMS